MASKQDVSTDFADQPYATTEVKETSRNFVKVVQAVRFAKGFQLVETDLTKLLSSMQEVEQLMIESNNARGLGAVHNNIAGSFRIGRSCLQVELFGSCLLCSKLDHFLVNAH